MKAMNIIFDIAKKVENRKLDIVHEYIDKCEKRGNNPLVNWRGDLQALEFSKDVMVELNGVWYRCRCEFCYETCEVYVPATWDNPDEYYENEVCDVYINSITEEKTKAVIKAA